MTRPKLAVLAGPAIVDQLDRDDVEVVLTRASRLLRDHELGFFEDAQVFHHRDAADVKVLADIVDAATGHALNDVEHFAAWRASECLKNGIHRFGLHV